MEEVDTTDLTKMEFGLPCDADIHQDRGRTGAAKWIVYFVVPFPCGCRPEPSSWLLCDECLAEMRRSVVGHGPTHRYPFSQAVRKIEPISHPT